MKQIIFLLLLILQQDVFAQSNTLPPSGDIGIGTTSPAGLYTANVRGLTLGTYTTLSSNSSSGWSSIGNNAAQTAGSAEASGWTYMNTDAAARFALSNGSFRWQTAPSGTSGNAITWIDVMSISNNGNVGLGTTNPGYPFVVKSSVTVGKMISSFTNANSEGIYFYNTGTDNAGGYNSNANTNIISSDYQTGASFRDLAFATHGTTRMTIQTGGNIGVGTTSPSEKLSVNGNVSAKKMIVTQTGWSDYVFSKDYKLRSLSSLETYITKNKHLPEVPAAKEVEEKGINVGDNQALLLKKIEELTLYVIDLKKITQEQQKQINHLIRSKK